MTMRRVAFAAAVLLLCGAARIYDVGGEVRPPVALHHEDPDLRGLRCRAFTAMHVVIDEQGNVLRVWDVSPHPDATSAACAAAVRQWKFRPATLHERPVAVRQYMTVSFRCQ